MKKIGIAVFALMFAGTAYVGAQEIEIDFDGKSDIQKSQSIEGFSTFKVSSDIKYDIPVPKRVVNYEHDGLSRKVPFQAVDLNKISVFYSEKGHKVENLHIVKMLEVKNKRDKNYQTHKWGIDFKGNIYSMDLPANAMDFKKIKEYISFPKKIKTSKMSGGEWLESSEEYEVNEVSWDGLKKKICKVIKKTWCHYVCDGAGELEDGCRKLCRTTHDKICRDA